MTIIFNVDLARYTDNQLYNMLTSGILTRDEYRAEMAVREQAEREQMGAAEPNEAMDRAYDSWKANRYE